MRPKLRTQVLAGVLSITLLALAAFDIAAISALHRYLVGQTEQKLQSALVMTQPRVSVLLSAKGLVAVPGAYDIQFVPASPAERPVVFEYAAGVKPRPEAGVIPATRQRPVTALSQKPGPGVVLTAVSHPDLIVVRQVTVRGPAGTLVASTSLNDVNAAVGRFRFIVIAGSAAAGLLIFAGVVLVMRRGLRPLETMATRADLISATHLNLLADIESRSEVGRLGTALNGMLARIETSVAEQEASQELMRRFFADASHELRNPLASLRANAELYQQGALRQPAQVDEAMRRIALEARRMCTLVDDMLRLARLDTHPVPEHQPVDLTGLLRDCAETARIADPARTYQDDIAADLGVSGDRELLHRAFGNLLMNVRTHTPEGTTATLTATRDGSQISVAVSDDGPGVPAGDLSRIFDRFYRASAPAQRPGSGLGLAIAAEIAAAHGGTAAARPGQPCGLTVTLAVPQTASTAQSLASAMV
jgi:two-component system OmpR family sensor kinase